MVDEEQPMPTRVARIIKEHHRGGATAGDCVTCCAACCVHSGFAILENVIRIYDLYVHGRLERADYEFEPGLPFRDFVLKHFDVWCYDTGKWFWKRRLMTLHMKHLSEGGHLVSIPDVGGYWHVRGALFEANPWLSRGCVFLTRMLPPSLEGDEDCERRCILHSPRALTHITAKPIDCVFYTCLNPHGDREAKVPARQTSDLWLRALAVCFPGSEERFEALIAADKPRESDQAEPG